jgi:hypothetical protein
MHSAAPMTGNERRAVTRVSTTPAADRGDSEGERSTNSKGNYMLMKKKPDPSDAQLQVLVTAAVPAPVPAPRDPFDDMRELRQRIDEAQPKAAAIRAKMDEHRQAMHAAQQVAASEALADARLADLEGRHIVDPSSVTENDLEDARAEAARAQLNAAKARPRAAALARALELLAVEAEAADADVASVWRDLDERIVAWARTEQWLTFARMQVARAEIVATVSLWNAYEQLIERIRPVPPGQMTYTGNFSWKVCDDLPASPDISPFRAPAEGRQPLIVNPQEIEKLKANLLDQLAAIDVLI